MAATTIEIDGGKLQLVGSACWESERHAFERKAPLHMARARRRLPALFALRSASKAFIAMVQTAAAGGGIPQVF